MPPEVADGNRTPHLAASLRGSRRSDKPVLAHFARITRPRAPAAPPCEHPAAQRVAGAPRSRPRGVRDQSRDWKRLVMPVGSIGTATGEATDHVGRIRGTTAPCMPAGLPSTGCSAATTASPVSAAPRISRRTPTGCEKRRNACGCPSTPGCSRPTPSICWSHQLRREFGYYPRNCPEISPTRRSRVVGGPDVGGQATLTC